MSFVLSEVCKGEKHYTISVKVDSVWKEIAKISKRSTAFHYMNLINQLSK